MLSLEDNVLAYLTSQACNVTNVFLDFIVSLLQAAQVRKHD